MRLIAALYFCRNCVNLKNLDNLFGITSKIRLFFNNELHVYVINYFITNYNQSYLFFVSFVKNDF